MPSTLKLFEMIIYSLLNFLPYIVIAIYPFRKKLRFSKKTTIVTICLATIIQIVLGIMARLLDGNYVGFLSVISTLIYAGFYFSIVKDNFGKTLFTLLILSNVANFVVMSSKCFEGIFFPELARQSYRWSFSLMMVIIQIIVLIPLFIYIKIKYCPAIAQKVYTYQWRYLWLIPTSFYLLWYHNTYFNTISGLEIALRPSNTVFLFLINVGFILVYNVVVQAVNEYAKNLKLQEKNHQLTMQALQFENLRDRISEARRSKHDLRHHLTLMTGYVDNNDYEGLKTYLYTFMRTLPQDCSIVYCEHYALNMLILYYSQLAKDNNIDFAVEVIVPADIIVSDCDLCVLVGNILENAMDACINQKSDNRQILLRGRVANNCLLFTIDNTFENQIRKNSDGVFLSTKHSGMGIGIESVKAIVERYNGVFRAQEKKGMFYVSTMLNLTNLL